MLLGVSSYLLVFACFVEDGQFDIDSSQRVIDDMDDDFPLDTSGMTKK